MTASFDGPRIAIVRVGVDVLTTRALDRAGVPSGASSPA
jgi:hypothetical protein